MMVSGSGTGKIIVGLDGSAGSRCALLWAVAEAVTWDAEIEAVYAWQVPALAYGAPGFMPPAPDEMDRAGHQLVEEMLADLPSDRRVKVHVRTPEGRALDVLRHVADEPDAGMVVVGSRGHGGVAEMLLGSVSHGLSHRCPIPVVIIPKGCDPVPGPANRGGIVVGVDGSRQADVALRWAAREAVARKADLDVVMAAWTSTVFPSRTPYPGSLTAALKDEAERIVTSALERLGPTEARLQTRVIEGQPAQVLLKEAEGRQLLVVGSRGLGRAREAFTGSVGHACAHHSTTPIAIVPSH